MNTEDKLKAMMEAARVESDPTATEWNAFARRAHRSLYARRAVTAMGAVALIAVGAVAAVVLTSNPVGEERLDPVQSPAASATPTPEAPSTIQVPFSEQELWFVDGEGLSWGTMAMGGEISSDLITTDDPVAQSAAFWLRLLVGGVPGPYQEAGDTTAIPEGTDLLGVERRGDTMTVDLSSDFESGGGSLSMQLRVAQVVYTATQFPGIDRVFFRIDGQRVESIGGEGIVVAEGLTRRDFQEGYIAPNIVVESPRPGHEVASGDKISGFANVFEANVSYRVRDENGDVLGDTHFTTATCGSGCWGDVEAVLEFTVDRRQEGRIEVLTFSAEDGSEQDVISIPVILVP